MTASSTIELTLIRMPRGPAGRGGARSRAWIRVDQARRAGCAGRRAGGCTSRVARVAGQLVEQVREVLADPRVGGEQAEVLVDPGGLRVVVAGADVAVARGCRRPPGGRPATACSASSGRPGRRRRGSRPARACAPSVMLACSSKRALISTSTSTCLPASAASISASTIGRVAGGAVERLLDRQHVRVGGRLLEEAPARWWRTSRTGGAAGRRRARIAAKMSGGDGRSTSARSRWVRRRRTRGTSAPAGPGRRCANRPVRSSGPGSR